MVETLPQANFVFNFASVLQFSYLYSKATGVDQFSKLLWYHLTILLGCLRRWRQKGPGFVLLVL